ncbi:VOC family protein [Blastococcus sp. SYSU D00669]
MARLFAYRSYRDAPAVLDWLTAVGFETVRRQDDETGRVVHCEVRLGDVVLMVSSNDADHVRPPLVGSSTGDGLYLLVEDVDGCHDRAVAAGGRSVFPPERTPFHTRRARVLDPEGGEWSFGTYEPGVAW